MNYYFHFKQRKFFFKPLNTLIIYLTFSWLQLFETKKLHIITSNQSVFLKMKKCQD